ncbi:hypothetical protein ABZ897_53540 [Nonomuraea sp. NPDC046802]|uniref:hypothetical protein n=1 Tax=Nonomuraea sp. NPDC046802 TaxID=3154919 RepID=UPI0033CD18E3
MTDSRRPLALGYSLLLGLAFAMAWLGFTAIRARDGRMPVTDWLDPMLAAGTLLGLLAALTALVLMWPHLRPGISRTLATVTLTWSPWLYIAGEVVSNTLTVGEPPADVGSLMEMTAGGLGVLGALALAGALLTEGGSRRGARGVTVIALVLATGMGWWFTHPIDQSAPGAPACVPGNALYNAAHDTIC